MGDGGLIGRLVLAGAGAVAARLVVRAVTRSPAAAGLARTNHRGRTVSLAAGPALAVAGASAAAAGAASAPLATAAAVVGLGAGAVGLYDDLYEDRAADPVDPVSPRPRAKGFHGHLGALREGRVTSGMVKIIGVGGCALLASALLGRHERGQGRRRGAADLAIDTGLIAGAANLANLFDLRPGRALKVGLAAGAPLVAGAAGGIAAGPLGAAAALLEDDLGERTMLGDGGANAFGALLGLSMAARGSRTSRITVLAAIAGLTLASEKVSFTKVIEATPVLRELDGWGRQPPPAA